jgi:hypothetical protein
MFIGHYAPAFAVAATRRGPRLGAMFVAAQFVDLFYFLFVIAGVERMRETPGHTVMNAGDFYDMPYTHSLLGTLGFAALWAVVVRLRRGSWRVAWLGAAVVASHWWLDLIVHAPDLTLMGIGRRYGFGLWNRPELAMPLELGIVALTLTFYASRTRATGVMGHVALAALVLALAGFQAVNWLSPQPTRTIDPVPAAVALTALAAYAILTALALWTGATRVARTRVCTQSARGS